MAADGSKFKKNFTNVLTTSKNLAAADDELNVLCVQGDAAAAGAQDWKADLIVVGADGRRRVGGVFLGSRAGQIIRLKPVPVPVICTPEGGA